MFHVKQSANENSIVIEFIAGQVNIVVPTDAVAARINLKESLIK